jgi:hypothetical protein
MSLMPLRKFVLDSCMVRSKFPVLSCSEIIVYVIGRRYFGYIGI